MGKVAKVDTILSCPSRDGDCGIFTIGMRSTTSKFITNILSWRLHFRMVIVCLVKLCNLDCYNFNRYGSF
jgi:hypothetical protein